MKKFLYGIIQIGLLTLFPAAALRSQEPPIRVETNVVTVSIAVTDAGGKAVRNLKPEQFEIFDDQGKRQIEYFSADQAPVTFGIIYDLHPTTTERTKAVLDSLKEFTGGLGEKDDFFLVAFNHRIGLRLDFIPTAEEIERQSSLASASKNEPRSLYDAMYLAADRLRARAGSKKTLLIISDSADHQSRHNISDLRKLIKSFDVQVYAVILDGESKWSYVDLTSAENHRGTGYRDANAIERGLLSDLTLKSGGAAHYPVAETAGELIGIYRRIAAELADQYTISFTPGEADGKWHDLRVRLQNVPGSKKFALYYRRGYQSPPPKKNK